MKAYSTVVTHKKKEYKVEVSSFGKGNIPVLIVGHAEVYGRILQKCYEDHQNGLYLNQYKFFIPHYWCKGSQIADLPDDVLSSWTWGDFIHHIEEIRQGLENLGLLDAVDNKIGLYCHSGFFILAALYGIYYSNRVLFIQAEAPPPFFTAEWPKAKALFFQGNASETRKKALASHHLQAHQSAVDEKNMVDFPSYINAYYKMAPTLLFNFKRDYTDYKDKIWGSNEQINMVMMKRYFQLVSDCNGLSLLKQLQCSVFFVFGALDTAVPLYYWTDLIQQMKKENVDYYIHIEAAHWPYLEMWEKAIQSKPPMKNEVIEQVHAFIVKKIMPLISEEKSCAFRLKSKL